MTTETSGASQLGRVLVTGCAGFIGSHLSERLLESGCEVVGVDCFNDNYGRDQKLLNLEAARSWDNFDFLPLDLARGDLADLVDGCDAVFHMAAEPGVRASWGGRFETYVRNNVLATQLLLEATKGTETRFVYASSSSVYGQAETYPTTEKTTPKPFSPYGVTKLAAEHLCLTYWQNFGVPTVSHRFFTVYGPRQRPDMAFTRFLKALHGGEQISVYGDGHQSRDFTYIDDIVTALVESSIRDEAVGEVFNLGGGSQITVLEVLDLMREITGTEPNVVHLDAQAGDVRMTGADTSHARNLIGFDPQYSVAAGIAKQYEWVRQSNLIGSA
jgi:UDP-glucuronate 4-epimerase